MKLNTLLLSSLFTATLLAGCDKGSEQTTATTATPAVTSEAPAADNAKEGFGPVADAPATAGAQAIEDTKEAMGDAAATVQENVSNAADQAASVAQEAGKEAAQGAGKSCHSNRRSC